MCGRFCSGSPQWPTVAQQLCTHVTLCFVKYSVSSWTQAIHAVHQARAHGIVGIKVSGRQAVPAALLAALLTAAALSAALLAASPSGRQLLIAHKPCHAL